MPMSSRSAFQNGHSDCPKCGTGLGAVVRISDNEVPEVFCLSPNCSYSTAHTVKVWTLPRKGLYLRRALGECHSHLSAVIWGAWVRLGITSREAAPKQLHPSLHPLETRTRNSLSKKELREMECGPGRIRTPDTRLRRPMLYPG